MSKTLHEILSDPEIPFIRKLQIATTSELVFWEERYDPPNLSAEDFKRILPLIPLETSPILEPRKSSAGKYGKTGETQIFKFDFEISLLGQTHPFFIKGFFFEKGNLRGVEIQSFRREQL